MYEHIHTPTHTHGPIFPNAKDAKKILMDYFLKLRREHHTKDSTPITTRQLEAMMRLTEARAKLDLSEIATVEHAQVSNDNFT